MTDHSSERTKTEEPGMTGWVAGVRAGWRALKAGYARITSPTPPLADAAHSGGAKNPGPKASKPSR